MKKDVGTTDRIIRVVSGIFLLFLAYGKGHVWGYIGVIPLLTGIIGWCPLYSIIGISSVCNCSTDKCNSHE